MSFQQGLSGLSASSKALDTIGNNISNSGTVGYKLSTAQFADVFAASLSGAGASPIGLGTKVATVAQQFTQGNISVTSNPLDMAINGGGFYRLQDTTGGVFYSRNGQFQLDKDGYIVNAAGLQLTGYAADVNGTVNPPLTALRLFDSSSSSDAAPQGTGASTAADGVQANLNLDSREVGKGPQGVVTGTPSNLVIGATNNTLTVSIDGGAPQTVTIPSATYADAAALAAVIPAITGATVTSTGGQIAITSATTGTGSTVAVSGSAAASVLGSAPVSVAGSTFNYNLATTYNKSTAVTIYDSLGNSHVYTMYFVKNATATNTWDVYATLSNPKGASPTFVDLSVPNPAATPPRLGGPVTTLTFNPDGSIASGGTPTQTISDADLGYPGGVNPMSFPVNLGATTQYGSTFTVNSLTQDGFASGKLAGFSVGDDGTILGKYTNGQSKNLGQVILASFRNPQGLQPLGNNVWAATSTSGAEMDGAPGSSGQYGPLQSSALEDSNVDLTKELVDMIVQQRVYQANAQTIKTQDQVLQTLVNLR